MDLTYDWKSFQNFFSTKNRLLSDEFSQSIHLIVEKREIISVFAEGENLSDWIGSTCDELIAAFPHREIIIYEREKVEQWIQSSVELPHFYDQIQSLSAESKLQRVLAGRSKGSYFGNHKHFLLELICSRWARFFPSIYGIYIRLDQRQENSLFIIIQRKRIQSFYVPDFSGVNLDRRKSREDIIKILSERYLVPVQGLFLSSAEWNEWSTVPNPWAKIALTLKRDRAKLSPFRWSLIGMLTLQAAFQKSPSGL